MEYFLSMRGAAAFLLLGLFSLWLARTLKIRRPGMPSWVALVLAFILLFEPSQLAFILWDVHEKLMESGALMIKAYTFLKAGALLYVLFIVTSIFFSWQFYLRPSPLTLRSLRFGLFLPIAFAAVTFLEAPKMIWGERAYLVVLETDWIVIWVAVLNLIVLALTFIQPGKSK